ncbi:hypothetical protein EYF80_030418 [Liparis tanakae]|uniref:Uncharacterized protein n=1 Tax=Liparis tanakae TaxID=230148 RepID=A0A4Z2H2T5_9TELE|nr:hypothetical protein EYF80_030418 [Liparis tanakae]
MSSFQEMTGAADNTPTPFHTSRTSTVTDSIITKHEDLDIQDESNVVEEEEEGGAGPVQHGEEGEKITGRQGESEEEVEERRGGGGAGMVQQGEEKEEEMREEGEAGVVQQVEEEQEEAEKSDSEEETFNI